MRHYTTEKLAMKDCGYDGPFHSFTFDDGVSKEQQVVRGGGGAACCKFEHNNNISLTPRC